LNSESEDTENLKTRSQKVKDLEVKYKNAEKPEVLNLEIVDPEE